MQLSRQQELRRPLVGFEASESAVALVGMEEFRLLAAAVVDGELHELVETIAQVVGCSGCGTRALSKGRRDVRVRTCLRATGAWWSCGASESGGALMPTVT